MTHSLITLSFEDWYKDPHRNTKVLDLRQHASFDLSTRLFELPPRQVPLVLWVDESTNLDAALNLLQGTQRKQKPWNVQAILRGGPVYAPDMLPRLWDPDSMVENILLPLLKETTPAEVWDLGAGVGRDVVFLAESLRDRPVVALDQRYAKQAEPFWEFCQRRKVSQWTSCCAVSLEQTGNFQSRLEQAADRVGCFYAVRFWNKALFRCILDSAAILRNGTLVAISHFGKATPDAEWPHAHPKQVLERYELRDMVQGSDWNILCDRVVTDSDHGRTLIQFVVQLQKKE